MNLAPTFSHADSRTETPTPAEHPAISAIEEAIANLDAALDLLAG